MNKLSGILNETLKKLSLEDAAMEARAVMLWPKIVGETMSRASEAMRMQGGTLVVTTRSSTWNQEFAFQKPTILRRYQEILGKELVRDLRFVVGPVRGVKDSLARQAPPEQEVRKIRLLEGELERIRAGSVCDDEELGQAIRRALTREAQLRQWHLEHGAKACPRCGAAHRTSFKACPACRQDDANANERL